MPKSCFCPGYKSGYKSDINQRKRNGEKLPSLFSAPKMPIGLSWPRYLAFLSSSLISMFAGAQVVHSIYRPLDDLQDYVEQERERVKALNQES